MLRKLRFAWRSFFGPGRAARGEAGSDESGQDIIESALTLMFLLSLTFGIVQFGLVIFSYNTISYAAREGARFGIVSKTSPWTEDDIEAHVNGLSLPVDCDGGLIPVATVTTTTVRVDVDCDVLLIIPMISQVLGGTIPLHASATMQME